MEVLCIVSQEILLTKVNHRYPKVGKIRERKGNCHDLFEGHQALGSRSFELGCFQVQREYQGCELQGNRSALGCKEDF